MTSPGRSLNEYKCNGKNIRDHFINLPKDSNFNLTVQVLKKQHTYIQYIALDFFACLFPFFNLFSFWGHVSILLVLFWVFAPLLVSFDFSLS